MSDDLTHDGEDEDGEPEEIREGVGLAGADVEVPREIEERLRGSSDDEEEL